MSRANKQSQQQPLKPKFDTRPYQRPGLNETDILEIKDTFDLYDREHVGSINPAGTSAPTQNSRPPSPPSAPKRAPTASTR